jgi:hypothetical protein
MSWQEVLKEDTWDLDEVRKKVWLAMLELKKLTERRGLEPRIEQMMLGQWMRISQKMDEAKTEQEWEYGVNELKLWMNTVLNNDFRSEADADRWLEQKGFILGD